MEKLCAYSNRINPTRYYGVIAIEPPIDPFSDIYNEPPTSINTAVLSNTRPLPAACVEITRATLPIDCTDRLAMDRREARGVGDCLLKSTGRPSHSRILSWTNFFRRRSRSPSALIFQHSRSPTACFKTVTPDCTSDKFLRLIATARIVIFLHFSTRPRCCSFSKAWSALPD